MADKSKIKFLVDESSGNKLSKFLLEKGFDTKFVTDIMPSASDKEVLDFAEKEKRVLITNDKDFGGLIFRLNRPSSGVILLRLKTDSPFRRQNIVWSLIGNESINLTSSFVIVTDTQIRVRKISL